MKVIFKKFFLTPLLLLLVWGIYKQIPKTIKRKKRFRISFTLALIILFEQLNWFNRSYSNNKFEQISIERVLDFRCGGEIPKDFKGIISSEKKVSGISQGTTTVKPSVWENFKETIRSGTTAKIVDQHYYRRPHGTASISVVDGAYIKDGKVIKPIATIKQICLPEQDPQVCPVEDEEAKDGGVGVLKRKESDTKDTNTDNMPKPDDSDELPSPDGPGVSKDRNPGGQFDGAPSSNSDDSDEDLKEIEEILIEIERLSKKMDEEIELHTELLEDLEYYKKDTIQRIETIFQIDLDEHGLTKDMPITELEKSEGGREALKAYNNRKQKRQDKINEKQIALAKKQHEINQIFSEIQALTKKLDDL